MVDYSSIFKETNIVSISEMVYEALKVSILSGKLRDGEQVNERTLAKHMRISVTPVKDALRKLEKEGLVVIVPRKGTFVAQGIMTSIEEIYRIRAALESVAAYLAATKLQPDQVEQLKLHFQEMERATRSEDLQRIMELNNEFHSLIRRFANNSYLSHQLGVIRSFESLIQKQFLTEPEELKLALADHRKIYEAIINKDAEAAEKAAIEHVNRTVKYVRIRSL